MGVGKVADYTGKRWRLLWWAERTLRDTNVDGKMQPLKPFCGSKRLLSDKLRRIKIAKEAFRLPFGTVKSGRVVRHAYPDQKCLLPAGHELFFESNINV